MSALPQWLQDRNDDDSADAAARERAIRHDEREQIARWLARAGASNDFLEWAAQWIREGKHVERG